MTPEGFKHGMGRLIAVWPDRAPSAETVAAYADALDHLNDRQFLEAVTSCVQECRFFPTPAEILDRVTETREEKRDRFMARYGHLTTPLEERGAAPPAGYSVPADVPHRHLTCLPGGRKP